MPAQPGSGLTNGHGLICKLQCTGTTAELVSECQTSYIEDASAPVDNIVDVAGRGDIVQTECH